MDAGQLRLQALPVLTHLLQRRAARGKGAAGVQAAEAYGAAGQARSTTLPSGKGLAERHRMGFDAWQGHGQPAARGSQQCNPHMQCTTCQLCTSNAGGRPTNCCTGWCTAHSAAPQPAWSACACASAASSCWILVLFSTSYCWRASRAACMASVVVARAVCRRVTKCAAPCAGRPAAMGGDMPACMCAASCHCL